MRVERFFTYYVVHGISLVLPSKEAFRASLYGMQQVQTVKARFHETLFSGSGPETVERKRVTRKADGKLALLVNLGVLGRKADAYPFKFTQFSLPILAYPISWPLSCEFSAQTLQAKKLHIHGSGTFVGFWAMQTAMFNISLAG